MIHLAVPNLTGNERKYLNDCIDTTFVSSVGEYVNRIEKMSAELTGTQYGVATSSGTTGLHLALIASGVKRDDLVIIPSFTFIATANAVVHAGATPWFMDIRKDSWTIDVDQIKRELEKNTKFESDSSGSRRLIHTESGKRVAAIMPVYTLGNIPEMDQLMKIAEEYEIPVIADAAAAMGAEYMGKKTGELSPLTVFSFNGNKTVTAGGGGMVVGNDKALLDLCKHISTTARVSADYDFDMVGYNYRMTNIQAAVGVAQLEQLEKFVNRKREIRRFYNSTFENNDKVELFAEPENCNSACWFSGLVIKSGNSQVIKSMCEFLRFRDIEARPFWKPVHLQKPYADAFKANNLSVTEELWDKIITLPCSTNILDEELLYVSQCVEEGLKIVL